MPLPPQAHLYLASRSPRRRELLTQIGVRFTLLSFRTGEREDAETNEDPLPGETADVYACRVALAKARHGARLVNLRKLAAKPVLSADTTLDCDGEIIGKPRDAADASAAQAARPVDGAQGADQEANVQPA